MGGSSRASWGRGRLDRVEGSCSLVSAALAAPPLCGVYVGACGALHHSRRSVQQPHAEHTARTSQRPHLPPATRTCANATSLMAEENWNWFSFAPPPEDISQIWQRGNGGGPARECAFRGGTRREGSCVVRETRGRHCTFPASTRCSMLSFAHSCSSSAPGQAHSAASPNAGKS